MSATNLTFGIVIAVLTAFTIMMCTSMICQSRERRELNRFDPRTDEELAKDVQRALRKQGRR